MKVREAMTSDVGCCQSNMTLTDAAVIMWQRDCGAVPIVNDHNQIIGIITDRDICIAVATQNRLASEIRIGEIICGKVKSCQPDQTLEEVLKTMKKRQLRRLPVADKDGTLLGIISISDLLHAGKGREFKKKLLAALREISSFRPISLQEIASESDKPEKVQNSQSDADKINEQQFNANINDKSAQNDDDKLSKKTPLQVKIPAAQLERLENNSKTLPNETTE